MNKWLYPALILAAARIVALVGKGPIAATVRPVMPPPFGNQSTAAAAAPRDPVLIALFC